MRKTALFLIILILLININVYADFRAYNLKYSDITAYINHYPIPSFACDGKTVICAEDLKHFGFDVSFDPASMTLFITRNSEVFIEGMSFSKIAYPNGFPEGTGTQSHVTVMVNGYRIDSFAYNGSSMIALEDLITIGNVYWVPELRAIKLWIDGIHITEYMPVKFKKPSINPKRPMIALTFDDGPSANTDKILDVLSMYGAKATFFVAGERVEEYSRQLKRAFSLGMEIGNHTYSHTYLTNVSQKEGIWQISKTDSAISKITGSKPSLLRPPGGWYNDSVCSYAGKPVIMWSVDTLDWKYKNAQKVSESVLSARDGDIVLMHDLYPSTADAVETVVPRLIEKGYQLVTVSELAYYKGFTISAGKVLRSIKQ